MDAGAEGPLQEFGRSQGLGRLLWAPDAEVLRRAEASSASRSTLGWLVAGAGLLMLVAASTLIVPGGYNIATALTMLGALSLVVGVWVARSARVAGTMLVAVFENGLLLPSSFESGPGLETVAGPTVIRREDVMRIEEIEREGERGLLVWSSAGRSGVLTRQLEGTDLSPAEGKALMAGFVGAVAAAGYPWGAQEDAPP